MVFRKIGMGLVVLLAVGMVSAAALPDQSTLTLTAADGTLVGSGTYVGGDLTLAVSDAFTGDATLTVTTRGGGTLTYAVTVNADGSVTLAGSDTLLQDLNPSIAARGGAVAITPVDPSTLTPPTLPDAAANANVHATLGIGNAAAAASVGVSHADPHAGRGSGNSSH